MLKWPFVKRKTYDKLLADFQRHEDHYWKQAAHNGMWERKYRDAVKEIERHKAVIDKYTTQDTMGTE